MEHVRTHATHTPGPRRDLAIITVQYISGRRVDVPPAVVIHLGDGFKVFYDFFIILLDVLDFQHFEIFEMLAMFSDFSAFSHFADFSDFAIFLKF